MNDPIAQIFDALYYLRQAPDFIRKHKLWKGYWKNGWVAKTTVFLAGLFTIIFILDIKNSIENILTGTNSIANTSIGMIVDKIHFGGGIKYLLLILLEMLIFHFTVKTLNIIEGQDHQPKPKEFIDAQIRMIKVSIRNYFLEIVFSILIGLVLSVVGLSYIKSFIILLIQFYFIGFAFMDNFFEQKNMKIKESGVYIRQHAAAAGVIGAFGYILFMIPLLGALIAPFICSVAATTYLYFKSGKDEEIELSKDFNLEIT